MALPSNIDLTSDGTFSKEDPLKVKVHKHYIEHPRIPWKIKKDGNGISKFYTQDSWYTFPNYNWTTTSSSYFNDYNIDSSSNTFSIQFDTNIPIVINSNTLSNYLNLSKASSNITKLNYDIEYMGGWNSNKDIFGKKKKIKSSIRIPNEFYNHEYSITNNSRIPKKIHKKDDWSKLNNYHLLPDEFFPDDYQEKKYHYNKISGTRGNTRIPWISYYAKKHIRVGKRQSVRGIEFLFDGDEE